MYERFHTFRDFYRNNKELSIALSGIVLGWLLKTVGPYIFSQISRLLKSIGQRLGGRLSYRGIQDSYLNWVVLNNQDLNLTGIVGSGEKPKLEQIFISLRVAEEFQPKLSREDKDSTDDNEAKSTWTFVGNYFARLNEILKLPIPGMFAEGEETKGDQSYLYQPSRFCRTRQFFNYDSVISTLVLTIVALVFMALPLYLIAGFEVSILRAGIATIISLLPVLFLGAVILDSPIDKSDVQAILIVAAIFSAVPVYGVIKAVVKHQPALGFVVGFVVALLFFIFLSVNRNGAALHRKERTAREVGKLLSSLNAIAILGKPGAGKSTYMQFLSLTFAQAKAGEKKLRRRGIVKRRFAMSDWLLPISVPLRKTARFISEAPSAPGVSLLIEAFKRKVLPSNVSDILADSYLRYMLERGKCLLLLDGLDEVADDKEFDAVTREIMGLVSSYPTNKFIVTSRYAGWRGGLGSSFRQFQVDDLNDGQIDEFIDTWYEAIEENRSGTNEKLSASEKRYRQERATSNSSKLKQGLRETAGIRRLAENPLLLSIICFVHYHKTLPKERVSLYQDCSNLLLVQWDQEKGLPVDDTNLTLARKESIMKEIAYAMHSGRIGGEFGRKEAREDELVSIVASNLALFKMDTEQAPVLFKKLIDRSGIMLSVEKLSKRYAFSHLTFQEFYAAKYIHENNVNVFESIDALQSESEQSLTGWWREVILLLSSMQNDPSAIISQLTLDDNEDRLKRKLQIAAQSLSEAVQISQPQVEQSLLRKLLYIRSAGKIDFSAESMDQNIRGYLLGFAMDSRFYHSVISLALQSKNPELLTYEIVPWLLLLIRSADRELQSAAATALIDLAQNGKIRNPINLEELMVLLNTPSPNVQLKGLRLIALINSEPLSDSMSARVVEVLLTLIRGTSVDYAERSGLRVFGGRERIDSDAYERLLCEGLLHFAPLLAASQRLKLHNELINYLRDQTGMGISARFFPFASLAGTDMRTRDSARVVFELDTPEQRMSHREQLIQAVKKGIKSQQVMGVTLLTYMFGDDRNAIHTVIGALGSRFSEARLATLSLLPDLSLGDREEESCVATLIMSLKKKSTVTRFLARLKETFFGTGSLGNSRSERWGVIGALVLFHVIKGTKVDGLETFIKELPAGYLFSELQKRKQAIKDTGLSDGRELLSELVEQISRHNLNEAPFFREDLAEELQSVIDWGSEEQKQKFVATLTKKLTDDPEFSIDFPVLETLKRLATTITGGTVLDENLLRKLMSKEAIEADLAFDILMASDLVSR